MLRSGLMVVPVTRIFCGNCGSAIAHTSTMFPELKAIQTGNLPDFAKIPITNERERLFPY